MTPETRDELIAQHRAGVSCIKQLIIRMSSANIITRVCELYQEDRTDV